MLKQKNISMTIIRCQCFLKSIHLFGNRKKTSVYKLLIGQPKISNYSNMPPVDEL